MQIGTDVYSIRTNRADFAILYFFLKQRVCSIMTNRIIIFFVEIPAVSIEDTIIIHMILHPKSTNMAGTTVNIFNNIYKR